jgi:hypothetical protein
MSIFTKLKRSKKAAEVHKLVASEQMNAEKIPKPPYKHVPTHAFYDALIGSPSSWKHEGKIEIKEQRAERRSMSSELSITSERENRVHAPSSRHITPPSPAFLSFPGLLSCD